MVVHDDCELGREADKVEVLHCLIDRLAPSRHHEARASDRSKLVATTMLRVPLFEAAANIRAWGPKDKEEYLDWPVWVGVLPLTQRRLAPQPEAGSSAKAPAYAEAWANL